MKIGRIALAFALLSSIACNFATQLLSGPATPTPTPTSTSTPTLLTPAYIPTDCENTSIATQPASTLLAQPTSFLLGNPNVPADLQKQIFEDVVETVNKVYVYPDFNGKDWDGIVTNYRSKLDAGLSTEAFYENMEAMITELGDDHSRFESPVEVADDNAELAGTNEFVGIGTYVLPQPKKNQAVIISIFPNSPAEHAGLNSHDSILAADGYPLLEGDNIYLSRLRGPECSAVVLTVRSPGEGPRQVMLVRERITSPLLIGARLVATTDGSRIGYIFLPSFFDETIPQQVKDALNGFGELDGLIIDNRLNGGGSSEVLLPILSYFASGTLGDFTSRSSSRPLTITPHPIQNSQNVPMVVLVGEDTVSFGEIFSGVLQDSGRAKIVGQTTLGNVETLHGYKQKDGSMLWIAEETFVPAHSHANWEAIGIIPDVEAYADWDTFTFETDPSIAAALTLLGHK
ncbi:MAG TPA: S41 family peptidase [Anaerolineales bacterium]|nr:S41 family peptidase [Anaerolineales bacterium]